MDRPAELEPEIAFKHVPSLPGYGASSDGFVWTRWRTRVFAGGKCRIRTERVLGTTWRRLRGTPDGAGYLMVRANGRLHKVARLVAEAFLGPAPPDRPYCCHWDGHPRNNVPGNLRWDSAKGNAADATRHGTQVRGSAHGTSKLREAHIECIRGMAALGMSRRILAGLFGTHTTNIGAIVTRKTWRHVR